MVAGTDRRIMKPLEWRSKMSAARFGVEATTIVTSMGSIFVLNEMMPETMQDIKHFVAEKIILPHIGFYDKAADNLEVFKNENDQSSITIKERSEKYASNIVNFSIMGAVGIITQFLLQDKFNHLMGLPVLAEEHSQVNKSIMVDKAITWSAIIALNSFASNQAIKIKDNVAGFLQNICNDENEAKEKAAKFTVLDLPSVLGAVGSLFVMDKIYVENYAKAISHGI